MGLCYPSNDSFFLQKELERNEERGEISGTSMFSSFGYI